MSQELSHGEKSMLLVLSADTIMTLTVFVVFAYLRFTAPRWPDAFHFPSGLMAVAMTMFLLSGSFTISSAVRASQAPESQPHSTARWVAAIIAAWCCFVLLEGIEWARLILVVGVTLGSNPWNVPAFGATYFMLTGLHALHVIVGIVYLTVVGIKKWDLRPARWYVHFVNAMWLPLFFGLYLASTDLQGL